MKKLLVVLLAAMMVLSFTAVSMAAVTVGGEFVYGFNLTGPDTEDDPATPQNEAADYVENDFYEAKVTATAEISDNLKAFVALKGVSSDGDDDADVFVDETWAQLFGMVKVGKFGWNIKEKTDILDAGHELKNDAGISGDFTIMEGLTFSAYVARPEEDTAVGAKFIYSNDTFGAGVGYDKEPGDDEEAYVAVNGWYNIDPAVIYVTYTDHDEDSWAILGASFENDIFYARVEYEAVKEDGDDDADNAFRLGYKFADGAKIEYNRKAIDDEDAESSIKLKVEF
jgi:hypothetical protein